MLSIPLGGKILSDRIFYLFPRVALRYQKFIYFVVLEIEPRNLCMLGKWSTFPIQLLKMKILARHGGGSKGAVHLIFEFS